MDVDGKVAVITGAAGGLGLALARHLTHRGCRVVLADLDLGTVTSAARTLTASGTPADALPVRCDVRDLASVQALADTATRRHGRVDLVFNNAGVMPAGGGNAVDADPLDLDWVLSVNVVGTWNGCSVFGKLLRNQSSPSWIINTASEHALGMQHAGQAFYTASKHAILGLSDVLRAELPDHVGISVACPGMVATDLWNPTRTRPRPLAADRVSTLPIAQAVMNRGMPSDEAATKIIDGVTHDEFLIITHAASRPAAERRCKEILTAGESQAPYEKDWQRYDVNTVVHDVLSQRPTGFDSRPTSPDGPTAATMVRNWSSSGSRENQRR